jgi:hypothetical protein
LGEGQKSEGASGDARGRGGLGALRQRSSPDLKNEIGGMPFVGSRSRTLCQQKV